MFQNPRSKGGAGSAPGAERGVPNAAGLGNPGLSNGKMKGNLPFNPTQARVCFAKHVSTRATSRLKKKKIKNRFFFAVTIGKTIGKRTEKPIGKTLGKTMGKRGGKEGFGV